MVRWWLTGFGNHPSILLNRDACSVIVIDVGNRQSEPSSKPGWACLHFP